MNVLILTPDAVGSTLLQRVLTVYMQFANFDRPVINLHELTNGLAKFYSPDFNQEIVSKKNSRWDYHQSLEEIVAMLDSVDHYKTSRLAQYHIVRRNDPLSDQMSFYNYLNENFFIITCRRKNLFEHALSLTLARLTRLNVYYPAEKLDWYLRFYKDPVSLDLESFQHTLTAYKDYLQWCSHFNIQSYFWYEDHVPDIERFVLDLPVFSARPKTTFKDVYGIDFATWNRCHYMQSDVGSLALEHRQDFLQLELEEKEYAPGGFTAQSNLTVLEKVQDRHSQFLTQHKDNYVKAKESIEQMRKLGIMVSGLPIKKQTMAEKRFIIKNYTQCLNIYNVWAGKNPDICSPIDPDVAEQQIQQERKYWQGTDQLAIKDET